MFIKSAIPLLFFFLSLFLRGSCEEKKCNFIPNFIGSLLEINFLNEDPGEVFLQPYFYGGYNYGFYENNWSLNKDVQFGIFNPELTAYIGLTKAIEFDVVLSTQTVFFKEHSITHMNDLFAGFGFQFLWEDKNTYTPNLRFILYEIFPIGNFEYLNSTFQGTDATGSGAFGNQLGVSINKTFYTNPCHPFKGSFNLVYTYLYNTKVHAINVYGGGPNTKGRVSPGSSLLAALSLEYTFTPSLFFALDLQYTHTFTTHFFGYLGSNLDKSPASILKNPNDLLAILPAIEIQITNNFSIYFGTFLSLAGRNTFATAQGVCTLACTF